MKNQENKHEKIDENKIEYLRMASLDRHGRTFIYDGKFMRGIYKNSDKQIREMFACGLVERLNNEKLIPLTNVSEYYSEEYAIILEHKMISPVTYVFEWTYHMLLDAGKMILRLNKVLNEYGYKLWDCHTYNVLFDDNNPVYVDFGSFYSKTENFKRAFPYEQFKCDYILTAELIRKRGNLVRNILKINDKLDLADLDNYSRGLNRSLTLEKMDNVARKIIRKVNDNSTFIENILISNLGKCIDSSLSRKYINNKCQLELERIFTKCLSSNESKIGAELKNIIKTLEKLEIEHVYEWGAMGNLQCLCVNKGK